MVGASSAGNRRQRPWWARTLLPAAISLLMLLVLLELGSCAYLKLAKGYDGEHLMNYKFDPYKIVQLTPGFVDTRGVRHNRQGFRRDEDTPKAKPADTLRVFLMGGSTAYGLKALSQSAAAVYPVIRNDETIDFYLERALEGAIPGKKIEVINAAITSFYSHHHLIFLNQAVLKYEPDVIIFLDGFNDYYHTEEGFDQFRDFAYSERVHTFMDEPSVSAWSAYTGWWLFRKSHFVHVAGRAARNFQLMMKTGEGRNVIDVEEGLVHLRDNATRNFVKMVERNGLILRHEGVDAIFALQPEIAFEQSKTFSPLEVEVYDEIAHIWPENFIELKDRARPIVWDYLERAAAVSESRAVDLTDIYGGVEGDVYTDYCHLTPEGNRILAEVLVEPVLEFLQARVSSAPSAAAGR